ncbi:hypothetical protein [Cyanobacterium sp. Dongsha4]|uniref:hypothetical protein n=1 Tax=Cyanobacterium sp. DS4 TaxID=2878255 RepID=UPI002E803EB6|nr:hypothetical protein [Cyanobacterium sp. Dongsha4]WVL01215.1 hypothetical protein Dongsha4_03225 [Cyanobacterium sp. Dongsha4]
MELKREFFPLVRKTVMPRPYYTEETDVLGQKGTALAVNAAIYGDNWYLDQEAGLIEIYGAGAAICFRNVLPRKNKYEKEGLYLRLKLAYRTTENANVNIRTFSGRHITIPNSLEGAMYDDSETYWYVTDDLTLNINSIYTDEKLWIQRVDWEWVSKEVIYEDEAIEERKLFIPRNPKDIEKLYVPQKVNPTTIKEFLVKKIQNDDYFAKRCLSMLCEDKLMAKDMVELFKETGIEL